MKKIIFAFLLIQTIICSGQTNTNISNFTFWDTEPYIAINPTNSNNLIAAWMRATAIGVLSPAVSYSTNAGATWSTPAAIPHLYSNFTAADMSIAFNSSGDAFLSYIDAAITNDSGYVMVAKSVTGGASWTSGVKVMNALSTPDLPIDRPWIVSDNSGGVYNGRLYVVTKSVEAGALPHHIWMKYSADNGATWSSQIMLDDSIPTNLITTAMGVPTVGADGSLYIGYMSYDPPSSVFPRVVCLKSIDGGVTHHPKIIGYPVVGSPITDTLYQGSYTLSANPSIAGNLVFTFTDQRNGDPDILSLHSNDGGLTWTTIPVRINDDALSNGVGQDMSWAGFSNTGKYAVSWRDRRNTGGTSTSSFEMFTTVSIDGGVTFKPNYKVSSIASPFINIQKGNDFVGVCLDDNFVYNDWCDLRTGNTEIFVSKVAMSVFTDIQENIKSQLEFKLFPNPASDNVTLVFNVKEKQFFQISLCDMKGQLIKNIASTSFEVGEQKLQINTLDITTGAYMVNIKTENSKMVSSVLLKVEK